MFGGENSKSKGTNQNQLISTCSNFGPYWYGTLVAEMLRPVVFPFQTTSRLESFLQSLFHAFDILSGDEWLLCEPG